MKIATYYRSLFGPREAADRELIGMWRESWERHGWEIIVLGREDAEAHPRFSEFHEAIKKHPTVNDRQYEAECFLRHLAYQASGANVFSDFDLLNYGWRVSTYDPRFAAQVHSFMNGGPALYTANFSGFEWLFHNLMNWNRPEMIRGRPHVSDQTVFVNLPISKSFECLDCPDPGWQHALVVHYGNERVGPNGTPIGNLHKPTCIRELEKQRC